MQAQRKSPGERMAEGSQAGEDSRIIYIRLELSPLPGSLPFPRPLLSRCQICREIASGRGAQNGSCGWEIGQQTQKGKQATLGPQSQGASQFPAFCVHS